ncbi:hypothetical protein GCM10009809_31980 [Isoptericola hypogeus]|uniref:Error-prone DNA polymerase n=1 Tax=Isoptericola hypogeus TaxID=300179 RepID=A0ABN2JP38_9MICO
MTSGYAELHAHSAFSFLDGASHPEELAAEGARLGLDALALTDHDGLYGVVRFAESARKVGLPTVFGAELHLPAPVEPGAAPGAAGSRPVLDPPTGVPDPRATHLLVLARGDQGYRNLSRAIATAHLDAGVKGKARYDLERLGAEAGGEWLVLSGCRKGAVRRALTAPGPGGGVAAARRELDLLVGTFGRDNVAVEVTATGDPRDAELHDALAALAHDAGLPLVATTNAHYARPRDADLAGALAAVRARSSLDGLDGWLPGAPTAHLRSAAEMWALHARHPQAVAAAAALAAECAFDLRLVAPNLPPYPVPDGHDEATWLRELVRRGATDRYGPRPETGHGDGDDAGAGTSERARAWAQVDHELTVIQDLGFPGYFLVVYDLVEFCRQEGILCQGRGSAANSAVCYALGITAVDAVKHRLLFERFLAPERDGPPDIDIDIESGRREEVIQHVYATFGRTHAAQVANVISYRPRSAVRDAARALGYDVGQQDAWSKSIERWGSLRGPDPSSPAADAAVRAARAAAGSPGGGAAGTPPNRTAAKDARVAALWGPAESLPGPGHQRRADRPHQGHLPGRGRRDWSPTLGHQRDDRRVVDPLATDEGEVRRADDAHDVVPAQRPPSAEEEGQIPGPVLDLADRMLRLPRHLGIHSGGMVMCDRPVIEVCPVEWARMEGRTVLQWDKEDCADAGLVKFDLLGLGMLTAIRYAFDSIEAQTGERLTLHGLPDDDPEVYDLLCAADTVGVFQVESRAQMATLPRLRPRRFYDIVIEVALIRPGPIQGGSVHPYIERARGREPVTFLHPLLESSLGKTKGVPLFQEQLMQMAIDVAGFTPKESDQLRRAMGSKRSVERMEELRGRLLEGMRKKGVDDAGVREEIYDKLKAFADFGFPESHAYSFAYLVYASSWLKVHHPAAFYAGLLAAQPMGFYSPQSLAADARRHGVQVLRPDVNASRALAGVERTPPVEPVDAPPVEPVETSPGEPVETSPVEPVETQVSTSSTGGAFGPEPDRALAVRLGLGGVRSIGDDLAEQLVAERETNGPFRDLRDLARRVALSTAQLEALATAGATEGLGTGRREALWAAGALGQEGPGTLPGVSVGVEAPTLPGMTSLEVDVADAWATGITPGSTSPLEHVRDGLVRAGVLTVAQVASAEPGRRVAVGGVVTHRQRPGTAGGVTFLSLEDETGLLNVICTAGLWRRFAVVARAAPAMVVRGRVERADGAVNLLAEHLASLRLPVATRSRDFR